jgi:hypothetical protein
LCFFILEICLQNNKNTLYDIKLLLGSVDEVVAEI